MTESELSVRVRRAAEATLAEKGYVAPIDVLVRLGWLAPARVEEWRQGRLPALERGVQVNLQKLSTAMRLFRHWAAGQGLQPSWTAYVARSRDRRELQFSIGGDPAIEKAYRTHWVSPDWSEAKRRRLAERQSKPPDLVVIEALGEWTCTECSGTGQLMLLEGPGPLCMACADLDHLVFLPRGDATLTRRAKKASSLSAVVVRFSQTRKRYERQGTLVEEPALAHAEAECLGDDELRARRRKRDEERRARLDGEFQASFGAAVAKLFPACPSERTASIAAHAALRGSGRVGRTAAGRALDPEAVRLAVVASIRHRDTPYDNLLMSGVSRANARAEVRKEVDRVLDTWATAPDDGRGD